MKGRLNDDKWYVSSAHMGTEHHFIAARSTPNGTQEIEFRAHCLACAKVEILSKYGGRVDLRGWQRQGSCGMFLVAMQVAVLAEQAP